MVARQAGSAAALAPVVRLLAARSNDVELLASSTAAAPFEQLGFHTRELPDVADVDGAVALIADSHGEALLTGTSLSPGVDALFWAAARELRIRSVAVLDNWVNYAERFSYRSRFDSLPDVLAVMDNTAATELAGLGFPADRLVVTGHPHLDAILPLQADERRRARKRVGLALERRVVLFASEAKTEHSGSDPSNPRYRGYTELTALEALGAAIAAECPDVLLVVRPHPRERVAPRAIAPIDQLELRTGTVREAIAVADVITGMTSAFLLEAARAGVPTLSIRPNGEPEHFIEVHATELETVTDPTHVGSALMAALARSAAPRFEPSSGTVGETETRRGDPAANVLSALLG